MTAHIYVKGYSTPFNWDNCYEIPFEDYSISESDFRNRTAKIVTERGYDLANNTYAVKIVNPHHETFTGVMLKKNKKPLNLLEYDCQDWNRLYMSKPTMDCKATNHKLIKKLLNYCGSDKWVWKGLLPVNKYEQRKYGSIISFNPMKNKNTLSVKDKTVKELVQQLIYSTGAYIDIYYNTTGVMQFAPYHIDNWLKSVADFHYTETIDYDWSFNTTDIITAVVDNGRTYRFKDLFGGNALSNMIYEQVDSGSESNTNQSNNSKTNNKTSKTNTKTDNPYKTKKKEVWVNMDNCWGSNTDHTYLNNFCKELRKLGWKVHNTGVGSNNHTRIQGKNGIWLTLYNGVDTGCLREAAHNTAYHNDLLNRNMKTVIGFMGGSPSSHPVDIRKGGKGYKHVGKAWDDNYSGGNTGLNYPAGFLAYNGIPFFYSYGNNPKKAAARFNSGGDSKIALEKPFKKNSHGYYANYNWGNKY